MKPFAGGSRCSARLLPLSPALELRYWSCSLAASCSAVSSTRLELDSWISEWPLYQGAQTDTAAAPGSLIAAPGSLVLMWRDDLFVQA